MSFLGLPDISPATLLGDRRVALAVTALAAAQLGGVAAGVGGWPCGASLAAHAFAPVLLFSLAAFAVAAFLPQRQRESFAGFAERLERRTRASALLLAALLLYWLVRLMFLPGAFSR
jgi:hypothetical protein